MPTGGTFLYRSLQQRLAKVIGRRLKTLHFHNGDLIPNFADLTPGVRTVIQEEVLDYGEAGLMAPEAADIPLVAVEAQDAEYRVVYPMAGFSYSFQESLTQQAAESDPYITRINTRRSKMQGARRVIEERCNDVAAYGESGLGFTGLLNNANVTLNDSTFDPFDAASTPDQIIEWFLNEVGGVAVDTNNVEHPTVALVSTELDNLFDRKRLPDAPETIKSFILRTQRERSQRVPGGIQDIIGIQECRSSRLEAKGVHSAGNNKDRIALYDMDPENLERHIMPGLMDMFPEDWVETRGGRKIYPMYSCVSETIIPFPGAIRYLDHPKKP
ncbi:DUF2184 domain-containing protein [Leptolyngbyaceae cyanobacterium CCMR0082]|uniref:DUF2184 domain-containing protein n=1 Tax=Adonisia turfae CCMR0082 TaxID=2304604 RepID=A0A6M0SB45_9CYAN|nr:major capsid family protein [Adonisia turfae]NEZ65526.1 DUF2184 domain-containing protein [Adonisia turfae CCMR0082]